MKASPCCTDYMARVFKAMYNPLQGYTKTATMVDCHGNALY